MSSKRATAILAFFAVLSVALAAAATSADFRRFVYESGQALLGSTDDPEPAPLSETAVDVVEDSLELPLVSPDAREKVGSADPIAEDEVPKPDMAVDVPEPELLAEPPRGAQQEVVKRRRKRRGRPSARPVKERTAPISPTSADAADEEPSPDESAEAEAETPRVAQPTPPTPAPEVVPTPPPPPPVIARDEPSAAPRKKKQTEEALAKKEAEEKDKDASEKKGPDEKARPEEIPLGF